MSAILKRENFTTSRLLDFFSEKELVAQIGHGKAAWPVVAVKELIDNALDACEDAGVSPTISLEVDIDKGAICVTDNGPGIASDVIDRMLDFSVRVSSREAYVSPTRGAQGNALKTLVAMPFVLDGDRGAISITSQGILHNIICRVDRIRQTPVLDHHQEADVVATLGTSVTLWWPDSARSILEGAAAQILQIADAFAFLNPHLGLEARVTDSSGVVCDGSVNITREPADPAWTKWLPRDPTSPHWYTTAHIERLIAAYITHDADHGRSRLVREFIAEFRGLSATAKQKAVLEESGLARRSLESLVVDDRIDHLGIEILLGAMKQHSKPVPPKGLGLIGREHLRRRCELLGCEMESFNYGKATGVEDGLPWVAETAFAWRGDRSEEDRVLITGVNWSAGIINPFRELGKWGRSLDAVLEQQRAGRHEPIVLVLHLACPRVAYADRGKSAIVIER